MTELTSKLLAFLNDCAAQRPMTFMEVCGTHTVSLYRSGLRGLLPPDIRLISGPGCPVCVTSGEDLDMAISLADIDDVIIATYGDMLRVPSTHGGSLADARAAGSDVKTLTSAAAALDWAHCNPQKKVVLISVGFETTTPGIAAVIKEGAKLKLNNFFVLPINKTVVPALKYLCAQNDVKIDGFLLPGHVCVITGLAPFEFLAPRYAACVVGFEPLEMLRGIAQLARQVISGNLRIASVYQSAVKPQGNPKALALMNDVFCPCDAVWRGLGTIAGSGLKLREEFAHFDAEQNFSEAIKKKKNKYKEDIKDANALKCRCGEVLTGKITPAQCPLFALTCTPSAPVGPCMVSSEGTCGAAYSYGRG